MSGDAGGRRTGARALPDVRLVSVFILVVLACWALEPIFLSGANVESALISYAVEIGLVTAGQTLVMITAGIDLSVGGIVELVGVCVGKASAAGFPTIALVLIGLGIGVVCGLVNGLVVTKLRVPPIMVTLATGILFRGIAEGLANGEFYYRFPGEFVQVGQGTWAGVPAQIWVATAVVLAAGFALKATRQGRWVYASGANLRAAKLTGVPTEATITGVYACSGALASVAALIMTARLASAAPGMGVGLELASITAAVLGGVSVFGGRGSIFGSILGVLTIAALRSGLTLHGVAAELQNMGVAVLLIFVLLISRVSLSELARSWRAPPEGLGTTADRRYPLTEETNGDTKTDGRPGAEPVADRPSHP